MKVLIVGLGSIANKHLIALRHWRYDVKVYALRSTPNSSAVQGVLNVYDLNELPGRMDFIIIATPTSLHAKSLMEIISLGAPIMLEKPPLHNFDESDKILELSKKFGTLIYCAFNLRFHPLILWLHGFIREENVLEVLCYSGSYLPDWRPNKDYRKLYSSKSELGGGVHLDLSHEIDYIRFLFGEPLKVISDFQKISNLEIDSIDVARYWLNYSDKVISVQLNYYRRDPKRTIEIIMDKSTLQVDLIKGTVIRNGKEIIYSVDFNIQDTYNNQMKYFLECLDKGFVSMNSFNDSLKTLKICLNGN